MNSLEYKEKSVLSRISIFLSVSALCLFSGCGDGTGNIAETIDNPKDYAMVYMRQALDIPANYTFTMSMKDDTIPLNVNYGGLDRPTKDITVNFKVAPELVATYNQENGTNFPAMPETGYSLEETSVTIPAGKLNSSILKMKVRTGEMLGPGEHLLPVTIEIASGDVPVNEKMKTAYFLIKGVYKDNPYSTLDRTNWTVTASSYNNSNAVPQNILDGSVSTYWASSFTRKLPQNVIIDMNEIKKLHGFYISGRRSSTDSTKPRDSGNPKNLVLETSLDGVNWIYSQAFTLENLSENVLYLNYFQEARYFKISINSSHQNMDYTWMVEVNAF